MSHTSLINATCQSIDGNPDSRVNKWDKNFDDKIERHSYCQKSDDNFSSGDKSGQLSRQGQISAPENVSTSKGMQNLFFHQRQQHQQQQHSSNETANAMGMNGNDSVAIANPVSLPPFNINNNVASMLVPNSNQNSNFSHPQQQQGQIPYASGRSSVPATGNNTAWLQHMLLNPINPLQNGVGTNGGDDSNGGMNNQTNAFARQQQQLQGNNNGNTDNSMYHPQQMSTQPGDTQVGASSIASSLSKQQQKLNHSLLSSQQVWPSQGQPQQRNLQQGLQLSQLLSLQQQQQLLPLNELASQLQLPAARQAQELQQQQVMASSSINPLTSSSTPASASSSMQQQQQQQQFLLLASMLQQNNNEGLSAALSSPEGLRLLTSFLLGQDNQVQQQQHANQLGGTSAGSTPSSSNQGVDSLPTVPSVSGIDEDALSNQQHLMFSPQSKQSQGQRLHGILPPPISLINPAGASSLDPNTQVNIGEPSVGAFPSRIDGPSSAIAGISSVSNQIGASNLSMPRDAASMLAASKARNGGMGSTSTIRDGKTSSKSSSSKSQFPRVLYCDSDDAILGEYQTLLRQQLELFEADSHDVINGTFRQGRTTPIRLGQIGLRCKHCAKAPLSVRTKGSVYCELNLVRGPKFSCMRYSQSCFLHTIYR
jgi:hypothetical protein